MRGHSLLIAILCFLILYIFDIKEVKPDCTFCFNSEHRIQSDQHYNSWLVGTSASKEKCV